MFNAITCINQRFDIKNCGIYCLAMIFNFSNPKIDNPACQKIGSGIRIASFRATELAYPAVFEFGDSYAAFFTVYSTAFLK